MTEKPILFSGPMIRAILEGRKTMTRRVIKPQPVKAIHGKFPYYDTGEVEKMFGGLVHKCKQILSPYGVPGEHLWVRETFCVVGGDDSPNRRIVYRASPVEDYDREWSWRSSIFMPRWASRITLEITDVRVQRIQDISEEDAKAEGVTPSERQPDNPVALYHDRVWRTAFQHLWSVLNAKRGYPWSSNCWVWVISFKRIAP